MTIPTEAGRSRAGIFFRTFRERAWPYQQLDSRLWASGRVKEFTEGGGCFVLLTHRISHSLGWPQTSCLAKGDLERVGLLASVTKC